MVVVGSPYVNITSYLFTYTTNSSPGEYTPTVFDNYSANVLIDDQPLNLQLWDTSGHSDYKKLRPLSYPQTDALIIAFSLVSPLSLEKVETEFLPEIEEHCRGAPYILVGLNLCERDEFPMHADEYKSKGWSPISTEEGKQVMRRIGAKDYIECDINRQIRVADGFEAAVRAVIHPSPIVKEKLETTETKKKDSKHLFWKHKKDKSKESDEKQSKDKSDKKSKNSKEKQSKDSDNKQSRNKTENQVQKNVSEEKVTKIDLKISSSSIHERKNENQIKLYVSPIKINEIKQIQKKLNISPLKCNEIKQVETKLNLSPIKLKESKSKSVKLSISSSIIHQKEEKEDKIPCSKEKNYFIDMEEEKNHVFIENMSKNEISICIKIIDIVKNLVMCKKILLPEEEAFEHVQNSLKEFELLLSIDHPCICKTYGLNTAEEIKDESENDITTIALFLEYLDFDLNEFLKKIFMKDNTIKTRIIIEIIHGMIYIHKRGLFHRDLRMENIRLNSLLNAKIVDFGFAKINESFFPNFTVSRSQMIGLKKSIFMAPELLSGEKYNNKVDVYSFAVILCYLLTGSLPKYTLKDKMNRKEFPLPSPSSSISEFGVDLISRCLSFDYESRPSFEDILNEIRENNYNLASNVNMNIVSKGDNELSLV